jgi:hypothetical protein
MRLQACARIAACAEGISGGAMKGRDIRNGNSASSSTALSSGVPAVSRAVGTSGKPFQRVAWPNCMR